MSSAIEGYRLAIDDVKPLLFMLKKKMGDQDFYEMLVSELDYNTSHSIIKSFSTSYVEYQELRKQWLS
jgi:hypothetical protein